MGFIFKCIIGGFFLGFGQQAAAKCSSYVGKEYDEYKVREAVREEEELQRKKQNIGQL